VSELTAAMLLDPAVLQDPYCFYAMLQEQAPVWVVPGTDVVAISSFELLSEAVARPEDFSSNMHCLLYRGGDGLPARLDFGDAAMSTLATADPPVHTTHRRAVFPELVARRMRTLDDDIRALSASAVERALAVDRFDFMATMGDVVPITVMARLIGFRDINPMELLDAAFDSTTMVGGTMSMDELNALVARAETAEAWIASQIADADEANEEILLAVRRALDAGTLHMGEATIILHTLLSAGGESTTSLLGNALRMLAEDPAMQQGLREKPELLDLFVEASTSRRVRRSCCSLRQATAIPRSSTALTKSIWHASPPSATSLSGTASISASVLPSRASKPAPYSTHSSSKPENSPSTRPTPRSGWTACWSAATRSSTCAPPHRWAADDGAHGPGVGGRASAIGKSQNVIDGRSAGQPEVESFS
jgi:hypothetical protein